MLETLIVVLIILWGLGLVFSVTLGGFTPGQDHEHLVRTLA
ncbi:hypothetical protein [Alishewanella sp. HL-SH06]